MQYFAYINILLLVLNSCLSVTENSKCQVLAYLSLHLKWSAWENIYFNSHPPIVRNNNNSVTLGCFCIPVCT